MSTYKLRNIVLTEFPIGLLASKGPLDTAALSVAALLPCRDLTYHRFPVRESAVETLAFKDADFNLGHIEPAGMFGRIVEKGVFP